MSRVRNRALSAVLRRSWRGNFWIWATPLLFFLGAFLFALFTLQLDKAVDAGRLSLPSWALGGGVSEAQSVLSVVASASISVLTLVFSSALVVLTLAAAQFGSFLLHDFIRLRITRLTLGMFVASFVYSLTVLTRVGEGASQQFVPEISAKVAVVMAFLSVAMLIGFIYTISILVQAQQVAALVAVNLRHAIAERQRANAAEGGTGTADTPLAPALADTLRRLDDEGALVTATSSGYLQAVQFRRLVRAAERADVVVRLAYRPGQFVLAGSTLAEVWPDRGASAAVAGEIGRAHVIGSQRTLQQDLEFAIDKLVQIALLALSRAINNTFNALICIDWLADGLRMLVENPSDWLIYHDRRGTTRVITQPLPLGDLVAAAFDKIRYASDGNPTVIIHLLRTFARLAPSFSRSEERKALGRQADITIEEALKMLTLEADRAAVVDAYGRMCRILGWPMSSERTVAPGVDLPPAGS